ncbi:MAG: iron chelate uptake ABC transporter family permease subunit, partial [Kiritimatiellia bacterium]|nr:iron chelate uptake ABC transporter family permease subunit [Kiritimatiellia bacterium]
MIKNRKIWLFFGVFTACLVVLPWIGAEKLNLRAIFGVLGGAATPDSQIFFQMRLPRVWMGLVAGGSLAMAG